MSERKFVLVYITASSLEEAEKIGKLLVEERLAACVNIIPEIRSFYWWEGKLCRDKEAVILAKTRWEKKDELIKRVKEVHSYTVPGILVLPVEGGLKEFLHYLQEETK
jgi:periplasmic divalent cation tolerance protein